MHHRKLKLNQGSSYFIVSVALVRRLAGPEVLVLQKRLYVATVLTVA